MQLVSAGTVDVTLAATSVVVSGSFVAPYEVLVTGQAASGWASTFTVTAKTATSFTVSFSVAAPANASLNYMIVSLAPEPVGTGFVTLAGDLITSIRDEIPDPSYNAATDDPLPDGNGGLFRASTLYRWLDEAIRTFS